MVPLPSRFSNSVFNTSTISVIFQAEERGKMISSDLYCEVLDLSGGENITELCKTQKKIKKTYSPRVSVETPVVSHTFQKA